MEDHFIPLKDVRPWVGGASVSTLRRWVHSGRLPAYMAGGRIVVKERDLRDFVKPVSPRPGYSK